MNTFICRAGTTEEFKGKEHETATTNEQQKGTDKFHIIDQATNFLERVKGALLNPNNNFASTEDLFSSMGMNQALFELAYKRLANKTTVVMKRSVNSIWVNQFNKHLLRSWNANMDIQFVADAYSCVVYIISYISKAEREMG